MHSLYKLCNQVIITSQYGPIITEYLNHFCSQLYTETNDSNSSV